MLLYGRKKDMGESGMCLVITSHRGAEQRGLDVRSHGCDIDGRVNLELRTAYQLQD